MQIDMIEGLGYIASALVAISFLMKDIVKLRLVNGTGCLLFAIYGLLIDSWPVAGMNLFIAGINAYYVIMIYLKKTPEK